MRRTSARRWRKVLRSYLPARKTARSARPQARRVRASDKRTAPQKHRTGADIATPVWSLRPRFQDHVEGRSHRLAEFREAAGVNDLGDPLFAGLRTKCESHLLLERR